MERKNIRIILFSILSLAIVILGAGLFIRYSAGILFSINQLIGNKIFLDYSGRKKQLLQTGGEATLIAVGDISYSRGVERIVKKHKDLNYPFLKIRDYLNSADLVFGNLETPITYGQEIPDFEMIFRSNPGTQLPLKQAGFTVLSLANNHTPNFGELGLKDTFNYLEKVGIKYVGAGNNEKEANKPVYSQVNGMKFAFLAYNDTDVVPAEYEAGPGHSGTAFMRSHKMTESVKEAEQKADFVVVSMHSGTEYTNKPNDSQISFAHEAIDAGADLVIGHHPHVIQTTEKYKGKYIFYSLGNFVFDQMWSRETREGLLIKVYFTKKEIYKISFLPVFMENLAQPRMVKYDKAQEILARLRFPLSNIAVYFWSRENIFGKTSMAAIYNKTPNNRFFSAKNEKLDMDNDSISESFRLENGRLTISKNSKKIWQTPADWWIDNFILADSNNDGVLDINLSLWKSGSFNSSKPFWIKQDDLSVKNHFFVYDLVGGKMKSIWGSSNLKVPNCEFKIEDIDADGKNDLIAVEGDYSQTPHCNGNYVAVWKWDGWGFSNEWRSEK